MSLRIFLSNFCVKYFQSVKHWFCPQYKDISDDIVLITGGGHGLGRKIALQLAELKPKHLIIWGRSEEWLQRTRDDIQSMGVAASYFVCDVSVRENIYQKAQEVKDTIGDVTLLINNAGVVYGGTILESMDENVIRTMQVNVLAHIWTIKAFLPSMMEKNHGQIVCMSSILGLLGLKGTGDYSASKFSTTGLMESLVQELEDYPGIHICTIHPYQIDNDMFTGVRIRFPRLFPPQKEDYVVKESVKAILSNRKQLIIPFYFNPILFLRSFLPKSCLEVSFKFFGLDKTMDALGHKVSTPKQTEKVS